VGVQYPSHLRGAKDGEADETQFWFHYDYLDESRQWGKGLVGWYTVKIDDPDHAVEVAAAIDERFGNSAWETSTETEKAFAAGFAKQIGNIRLIVMSIGAVVLFTLLLVTGSSMSTAVRERIPELGVLKTLGFGDGTVLGTRSGRVGPHRTRWVVDWASAWPSSSPSGVIPREECWQSSISDPSQWYWGSRSTLLVGILAGLIPALSAMRLKIVDALRRV
jgi:putative ABC transport system permease protein